MHFTGLSDSLFLTILKTWAVLLQYICALARESLSSAHMPRVNTVLSFCFLRNMASASAQCLPSEIICPICQDTFTDPATIRCGHRFCTPCLCLLWEDAPTVTCCPVCKAVSQKMDLKSIILAKKHIHSTGNSVVCQLPGSAKQMCRTHRVIKLYFCEADKSLLCLFCSCSARHATHEHHSIMQVAEHYRVSNISDCTLKCGGPCI